MFLKKLCLKDHHGYPNAFLRIGADDKDYGQNSGYVMSKIVDARFDYHRWSADSQISILKSRYSIVILRIIYTWSIDILYHELCNKIPRRKWLEKLSYKVNQSRFIAIDILDALVTILGGYQDFLSYTNIPEFTIRLLSSVIWSMIKITLHIQVLRWVSLRYIRTVILCLISDVSYETHDGFPLCVTILNFFLSVWSLQ